MKLFFAAPESFLPSELTAFGAHASRLHFLRKLLSAAPARGLPFLPLALLAHVSCAITGPIAKAAIIAAKKIRFMDFLLFSEPAVYTKIGIADDQALDRPHRTENGALYGRPNGTPAATVCTGLRWTLPSRLLLRVSTNDTGPSTTSMMATSPGAPT